MRYITLDTNTLYQHLIENVRSMAEANADLLDIPTIADMGFEIELPYCERDAWEGEEEDVLVPLGFLSIYYQKVNDPNEKDLRPRQLMPIETYESKAGHLLMRAYDLNAGQFAPPATPHRRSNHGLHGTQLRYLRRNVVQQQPWRSLSQVWQPRHILIL